MADGTAIEWTDATWNPITGCSVVSPGCTNCYAMGLAGTRLKHSPSRQGLTTPSKAGPVWNGQVRFNEGWLDQPLRWQRPRRIFVCAHGDLFHESVPDEWIDRVFAVMQSAYWHKYQVLTKRSARMRAYISTPDRREAITRAGNAMFGNGLISALWPLPNVWAGISAEDQPRADQRIPDLLATPAAKRFLSCEPLLGPIDLRHVQAPRYVPEDHEIDWKFDALGAGSSYEAWNDDHSFWYGADGPVRDSRIDWIIAGGESGRNARPMHPDWARSLRDQCQAAGVPFFFKQWGEWREFGHIEDGPEIDEVYADSELAEALTLAAHKPAWITADGTVYHDRLRLPDAACRLVERIGKKAAGAILDGRAWQEMPL